MTMDRNESKLQLTIRARTRILAFLLVVSAGAPAQIRPAIDDLLHLDRLAQLRSFVKVGSFSSYDRTGGNDDGFSGLEFSGCARIGPADIPDAVA